MTSRTLTSGIKTLALFFLAAALASPAFGLARWVTQTSPTTQILRAVSAVDSGQAAAVGDDQAMIKTNNSGGSWAAKKAESLTLRCYAISFPAADTGYVAGTSPPDGGDQGMFWKTTDGGETWTSAQSYTIDSGAYQEMYAIYFVSANRGWVTGRTSSGGNAALYRTDNGGTNWLRKTTGLDNTTYFGLHFVTADLGWVVGAAGRIYRTETGGENWAQQGGGVTANELQAVNFVSSGRGWIVGNAKTILKTTDGGNTWTPVDVPFLTSDHNLTAVHFLDFSNGWAAGYDPSNPFIIKTADGGNNWTLETLPGGLSGTRLYDIHFADQYNGWAVGGGSGVILKYVVDPSVTSATRYHPLEGDVPWARRGALQEITVRGADFQPGAVVDLSGAGITLSLASFESSSALKVTAAIAETADLGWRDVTVTNPDTGSFTRGSTFEILPNTVGPTVSNIAIDGAVTASSKMIPRGSWPPRISCDLEDLTGVAPATVNFKVLVSSPVAYYWNFSGSTVFTPDAADPAHKGKVRAVFRRLKEFNTGNIVDAYPIFDAPVSLYVYCEDRDSNPTLQLYDTVYHEGVTAGTPAISNFLTEPNYRPTPSNPVTFQFMSNSYDGELDIYIVGITSAISRKFSVYVTRGLNKIDFDGLDSLSGLLSNGIYRVNFAASGRTLGGGLMAIAR